MSGFGRWNMLLLVDILSIFKCALWEVVVMFNGSGCVHLWKTDLFECFHGVWFGFHIGLWLIVYFFWWCVHSSRFIEDAKSSSVLLS